MEDNGLILDPSKRELMHFTRRTSVRIDTPIMLPNTDGSWTIHRPVTVLRWLGFFFDPKLKFRAHIETMVTCTRAKVAAMHIAGNTQ